MEGYEITESVRARRLALRVEPDGRVIVTKPASVSLGRAHTFAAKHEDWIRKTKETFRKQQERRKRLGLDQLRLPRPRKSSKAYQEARKAARSLVLARLTSFNEAYGFAYGTISIRDQKTRWGSCSAAGNLSFNYRIAFLPPQLQDYVVVHELCHTKEHNHSERFWALVAKTLPEHRKLRRELRRYSS